MGVLPWYQEIMNVSLIAHESPLREAFRAAAESRGWHLESVERERLNRARGHDAPACDAIPACDDIPACDAIVDLDARHPDDLHRTLEALGGRAGLESVGRYVLVSDAAVYTDLDAARLTEKDPCGGSRLGRDLFNAENTAASHFGPERVCILRTGWIVGTQASDDRLRRWVERVREGGETLAPGPSSQRIQWLDATDLAEWTMSCLAAERRGTFNLCGPAGEATMGSMLEEVRRQLDSDAELEWVDPGFLLHQGVRPDRDLPLWIPECSGRGRMHLVDARAREDGFAPRTLEETVEAVAKRALDEAGPERPASHVNGSATGLANGTLEPEGLPRGRERQLIEAWRKLAGKSPSLAPAGREI